MTTPQYVELDPVTTERSFTVNRRRFEVVIYYRKPADFDHGREGNWICWGDSQPGKRITMLERGFTPLPQFGRLDRYMRDGSGQEVIDSAFPWGGILRHPDGPAQFPVEQILTYRWHRKPPIPGIRFPQLQGMKIVEYECPECTEQTFFNPIHLARHLRNSHGYEHRDLTALGQFLGIDFAREFRKKGILTTVIEEEAAPIQKPPPPPEPPQVETVQVRLPKRGEIGDVKCRIKGCDYVPRADSKNKGASMRLHLMKVHQVTGV